MRFYRQLVIAAAIMQLGLGSGAASAQTDAAKPASVHEAWTRYRDTLAEKRGRLLQSEFAKDPQTRAQGLYFLQSLEALAFNWNVAPRHKYPVLYVQSLFMPLELSWGMPNPDFLNHNGFIDGAHTYRVYGNRNGSYWATLQVFRGIFGEANPANQGNQANIDFDEIPTSSDGAFEIFLGPNPPADLKGKYWVKIDPNRRNVMVALRETFYDWDRQVPMDVHIECLDCGPEAPIYFDEAELATRIETGRVWAASVADFTIAGAQRYVGANGAPPVARNKFYSNSSGRQTGGNPLGHWIGMLYDIKPDEALIIEMPVIEARYWGFQTGSVWGQTTDYVYHQSSINGAQARIDADGKFRAVLSLKDPGIPNWLDPAGLPVGTALLRFYKSKDDGFVVPQVTKVKLVDLRRHLPKDTPTVTPQQRQAELIARRNASLRWYGQ